MKSSLFRMGKSYIQAQVNNLDKLISISLLHINILKLKYLLVTMALKNPVGLLEESLR